MGVVRLCLDAAKPQTGRAVLHQLQPVGIQVHRQQAAGVLHPLRQGKGLSSRGRADIQHPVAGLYRQRGGAFLAGKILHMEQPLPEGRQPGHIPGAFQPQRVFHGGLFGGDIFLRQLFHQRFGGGLLGINPDKKRRRALAALQNGPGRFLAVALPPQRDQRLGHCVLNGKGGKRLTRQGNFFAVPQEGPQHPIYIPAGGGNTHRAGFLHRLVHGGTLRDGGHIQQLVHRHPQDIPHGRGQLFHRLPGVPTQHPVQCDAPLHYAIEQRGAEGPLLPGKLVFPHQALQHQVGVAPLPKDLIEAPQGGQSCVCHGVSSGGCPG